MSDWLSPNPPHIADTLCEIRILKLIEMYKIEFLVIVSNRNTNSLQSLKNLLLSDDDIQKINNSNITVKDFQFKYHIETGTINVDQNPTYFILHFECEEEENIPRFVQSIRIIRSVLSIINPTIYKLWDDIAQYYSEKAYSKIYRLENLMRKLLTKFMYINLGINWTKERMPEEVKESVKLGNRDPNFLHNVDFIQLSNFLFSEKYPNHKESLITKLNKAENISELDLTEIKSLLPESNWSRYFEELVTCEGEFLSKRWDKLYKLRNSVAHSKFISIGELSEIEDLVDEITPILEEAINKLTKVVVPDDEIENIVENVASERNEKIGNFLVNYKSLENSLSKLSNQIKTSNNSIQNSIAPISKSLATISKINLIPQETLDAISSIANFRNMLVHNSVLDFEPITINNRIAEIIKLNEKISDEIEVNEEYHINKIKDDKIVNIYRKIKNYLLTLDGIEVKFNKHYISFKLVSNITDVKVQQKSVKVWLNVSYGNLVDPNSLAKNVSNIGHQGNGDYEVNIKSNENLSELFNLIKQSYEINKE